MRRPGFESPHLHHPTPFSDIPTLSHVVSLDVIVIPIDSIIKAYYNLQKSSFVVS